MRALEGGGGYGAAAGLLSSGRDSIIAAGVNFEQMACDLSG